MRSFFISIISMTLFFLIAVPTFAQTNESLPDVIELTEDGDTEVDNGPHFRFEEFFRLSEDLTGDTYIAGKDVIIDGNITGDLMVAGGDVIVNGDISEDLRIAGGNVIINGTVGKNVSVGGGTVTLGSDSEVYGSVVAGANELHLDGLVIGKVYTGASKAFLNGTFENSFNGHVDELVIQENAVLANDITLSSSNEPEIQTGAVIQGQRNIDVKQNDAVDATEQEFTVMSMLWTVVLRSLMILVGGALILKFLPQLFLLSQKQSKQNYLSAFGWGFLILFATPFAIFLLMLTMVGIPVAVLLLLFYVMLMIVSGWFTAFVLGSQIATYIQQPLARNLYIQLLIGAVVLTVMSRVPYIGGWVQFISLIFGIGIIILTKKQVIHLLQKK